MPKPGQFVNSTSAPTRARSAVVVRRDPPLLHSEQIVASPETGLQYRVGRLLGQGGFGQVFLSTRLGRSTSVPETVCIKVSSRMDGWLREAYFGQLLDDHPRAIRVYDRFPLTRPGGPVLYCLALEYAQHGDLDTYVRQSGRSWPESLVRREIAGVLDVLGRLHRGQLLHRDLTPVNAG
jgi:serine/threonine protein kinase